MKDELAVFLMAVAVLTTLGVLVLRVIGEPLNWPLFAVAAAAWVLGAVLWRDG